MVGLYMDVHVDYAIMEGLRRRGADVLTAQEDGARRLADDQLLDRATALGRVLFSQDKHLPKEAVRRQREGIAFAGVIYADQERVLIGRYVQDLEVVALASAPKDCADRLECLPL